MPLISSVALFQRNGQITFKRARKEASDEITHARKSASRFWRGNIAAPDRLLSVFTVHVSSGTAHIAERRMTGRAWITYAARVSEVTQPHILACINELGVDASKQPVGLPETLEINGIVYRREL